MAERAMIRHRHRQKLPAASGVAGSDTDTLNTDVMRFMSIIGLCLMAIFALVQTIPVQESSRLQQQREEAMLQQEVESLQTRALALRADLQRLAAGIELAAARDATTRQSLADAQQQLTVTLDEVRQAHSKRDHMVAELESLGRQLERSRDELASVQQAARDRTQSLQVLQQRLKNTQENIQDLQQQTRDMEVQSVQSVPPSRPVQPPAPPSPKRKQGFTLRFASTAVLDRLVAAGEVSLYGMAGGQAWRMSLPGGQPVFAAIAYPQWFHEMATETVPAHYVQSLEGIPGHPGREPVTWGVQLPTDTKQNIAALTRGAQGGDLVIQADGQVTLVQD